VSNESFNNNEEKICDSMPSWYLHEKWAVRAGIDPNLAREIDRLIDRDFGHHDIGRRRLSECKIFLYNIVLPQYSYEGAKAFLLHHILDYIAYIIRRRRKEARKKGATQAYIDSDEVLNRLFKLIPLGQLYLTKRGRVGISPFATTIRYPELGVYPAYDPYLINVVKSVADFLYRNFKEIVQDIANEIKRNSGIIDSKSRGG